MRAFIDSNRIRERFESYFLRKKPVILTGPTGCGKTTLVETVSSEHRLPLETVVCYHDMTVRDLLGGWTLKDSSSVWIDGPLTRAVKKGSVLYLDEIDQAPEEILSPLFSVLDHRKILTIPSLSVIYEVHKDFCFAGSYNPKIGRDLLPAAFRQRCLFIPVTYLSREEETELIAADTGIDRETAGKLLDICHLIRHEDRVELGTRPLLSAAEAIKSGFDFKQAVLDAIIYPLSDDPEYQKSLREVLHAKGFLPDDSLKIPEQEATAPAENLPVEDSDFIE